MGRRKQSPAEQAARNHAGRRKRDEQQRAEALKAARDRDEMRARHDVGQLRMPERYLDDDHATEREVWAKVAGRLLATGRAAPEFSDLLASYCDSVARYNEAVALLKRQGFTVETPMTNGGSMLRTNPAEKIRETALGNLLALSDRFGFSPRDNFALLKDHRAAIGAAPTDDLFSAQAAAKREANPEPGSPRPDLPPVTMDVFDSPPPGDRLQ